MGVDILPINNSTPWERALAETMDLWETMSPPIVRFRSAKMVNPAPDLVPYLIYEYGLGELTPYVPNLYQLLNEGLRWQRLRGTHAAVHQGIGWLGLETTVEEAKAIRNFWNAFQLHLASLPPADVPDLDRIENIASLSVPLRSKLRRGTFEHDIRAMETDIGRIDQRMLDTDSGIAIRPGGTVWSFSRTTEIPHLLTEVEGTAIGNWFPPTEDDGLAWDDIDVPWEDFDTPWNSSPQQIREVAMAAFFDGDLLYQVFRDGDGEVIGYRRAKAVHPVRQAVSGHYMFGGDNFVSTVGGTKLYVEAETAFNDADGVTATETAIVVGGVLATGVPPGRLWLQPGQLVGGEEIAVTSIDLPLRKTVRERIKTLLRF